MIYLMNDYCEIFISHKNREALLDLCEKHELTINSLITVFNRIAQEHSDITERVIDSVKYWEKPYINKESDKPE